MIIETLNSVYELNAEQNKIRRLKGKVDPTPRQGADGEWKAINNIGNLIEGESAFIVWEIVSEENNGAVILRTTVTSPIVKILDNKSVN